MKIKKRILCGILALLLSVGMVPRASAAGEPEISLSSGTVNAGASLTLFVSIRNNPGLTSCRLHLYFDTDVFEVDVSSGIRAAGGFAETGSVISNSIAVARENGRYEGAAGKDGVITLWYSSSGTDTTEDGFLLKVKLKAGAGVPNGSYTVVVDCLPGDAQNASGERLPLNSATGTVTVTGGTQSGPQPPAEPEGPAFADIAGHWAYDYIGRSEQLGLMEGYMGFFRPDDGMTRCEFVTALWRAMGEPKASKPSTFTDIHQDWYRDALAWAQENNVIQGTGGTKFEPLWLVSREQVAIILHRLSGSPSGMEVMLSGTYDKLFTDSDQIHSWARPGVYWTVYEEIYCGMTSPNVGNMLHPAAAATRAQIAVMLVRYREK